MCGNLNREKEKRPREIHVSPKPVLVFKINSPNVSAVTVSLTQTTALGRFQKNKNLSDSIRMEKEKTTSKGIGTYPSFKKNNRKKKHFYI